MKIAIASFTRNGCVWNQKLCAALKKHSCEGYALELSGTKVLMKAGKKMPAVKQFLKEKNCRAVMVENCGMDTEQKYFSAEEIPDQASYYSLIIVKEKRKK